jgi:O-antigen ligase
MAMIPGARLLLLVIVVALLLLGSSVLPDPRHVIFFSRFVALVALALVAVLGAWALREGPSWRPGAYAVGLGAFTALALISTAWSATRILSFERAAAFAIMAGAVLAVGLTWSTRRAVLAELSAVAVTLWAAMFASLVALLLVKPWAFNVTRLRGILENPNTIGVVAALVIPLAVGLAAQTQRYVRAWWWFVVGCAVLALIASGSRAGLLAVAAGTLAFCFQCRGKSRRYLELTLAVLLVAVAALIATMLNAHFGRFLSVDSAGRTAAWSVILRLWELRPWLGWGFGSTDSIFPKLQGDITQVFEGGNAHNAYLQTLFELGPLGLLILLACLGLALRRILVPGTDFLEAGVFGAVVAGVVNQLFESGLTAPGSIIAFNFWLLALASVRLPALPTFTTLAQPAGTRAAARAAIGSSG